MTRDNKQTKNTKNPQTIKHPPPKKKTQNKTIHTQPIKKGGKPKY